MVSVVEMCVLAGAHRVLALGGGGGGGGRMLEGDSSWAPVLVSKGAVTSSGTSAKVEAISWPELVWVVLSMCWCSTGWAAARLLLKDYEWQTKPRCLPQEHPTWGLKTCLLPPAWTACGIWRWMEKSWHTIVMCLASCSVVPGATSMSTTNQSAP